MSTLPSIFDPAIVADPYPVYRALREQGRVVRDEVIPGGAWILTHYADVLAALKDPRLSTDRMPIFRVVLRGTPETRGLDENLARFLLNLDPPMHTGLRALVSKAFTPRMVERLKPRIEALTQALLDDAERKGTFDLIADLAYPLPVTVISDLLGIPEADRAQARIWSAAVARFFGGMRGLKAAIGAEAEFRAYFLRLIAHKRAQPADDLLSGLIAAEIGGETLSDADLVSTAMLLFVAGHETTTHLIGNGLNALLANPAQAALLRDEPGVAEGGVEELLRYEGSAQLVSRIARVPMELAGQHIEAGEAVVLGLAAANRDPGQFEDPERLDLKRRDVKHVSFGQGAHYCLGAPLARVEAAIALRAVLERWPKLRPASDAREWQDNVGFRQLKALPLRFD